MKLNVSSQKKHIRYVRTISDVISTNNFCFYGEQAKLSLNHGKVSRVMRKPASCHIRKTKAQINCLVTTHLISTFVFATYIVQSLYFLNPIQAFCNLLWLYSPVYVGPCRKPRRWVFSQRGSFRCCNLPCWSTPALTHFSQV